MITLIDIESWKFQIKFQVIIPSGYWLIDRHCYLCLKQKRIRYLYIYTYVCACVCLNMFLILVCILKLLSVYNFSIFPCSIFFPRLRSAAERRHSNYNLCTEDTHCQVLFFKTVKRPSESKMKEYFYLISIPQAKARNTELEKKQEAAIDKRIWIALERKKE